MVAGFTCVRAQAIETDLLLSAPILPVRILTLTARAIYQLQALYETMCKNECNPSKYPHPLIRRPTSKLLKQVIGLNRNMHVGEREQAANLGSPNA